MQRKVFGASFGSKKISLPWGCPFRWFGPRPGTGRRCSSWVEWSPPRFGCFCCSTCSICTTCWGHQWRTCSHPGRRKAKESPFNANFGMFWSPLLFCLWDRSNQVITLQPAIVELIYFGKTHSFYTIFFKTGTTKMYHMPGFFLCENDKTQAQQNSTLRHNSTNFPQNSSQILAKLNFANFPNLTSNCS